MMYLQRAKWYVARVQTFAHLMLSVNTITLDELNTKLTT